MEDIKILAWYIHIKSGKEYYTISTIMNKTTDTLMVTYRDYEDIYVREMEDFKKKFKYSRRR